MGLRRKDRPIKPLGLFLLLVVLLVGLTARRDVTRVSAAVPGPIEKDKIGIYSPPNKTWYLKYANDDGWSNIQTVRFGSVDTSWKPMVGDWNSNDEQNIGLYRPDQKTWYINITNGDGWGFVNSVRFGSSDTSWIPVVGDWQGDDMDRMGLYSPSQKTWYLKDVNNDGWSNVTTVRFGSDDTSWVPVAGDWNGDGTDTIGLYSPPQKTWYLKDANNDGWGNVTTVRFGSTNTSWEPVAGDWNGDGTDTIGMYRPDQKTWYLKDANNDGWGGSPRCDLDPLIPAGCRWLVNGEAGNNGVVLMISSLSLVWFREMPNVLDFFIIHHILDWNCVNGNVGSEALTILLTAGIFPNIHTDK